MHLITGPQLDSAKDESRYLCPLQSEIVTCTDRYQYTEKANRVGMTWTDALRNVRRRLAEKKRDYLFTTQNWNGALEYGRYLDFWINIYDLGRFIISRSEEIMTFEKLQPDGSKLAVQEKVGIYHFDGGSRIILFSSSPWGLQTFEGDVGWDEAAFHDQQERMWAAIATRLQWGFDVSVWSAHNGVGSWFNQVLGKLAKAEGSGWKCRKITIYDAIKDGLVDKINLRSGAHQTNAEFLADCKRRALTPAIFAERFECAPSDAGTNITPWSVIENVCTQGITRLHVSDEQVRALFGRASECKTDAAIAARMDKMKLWLGQTFGHLTKTPAHYRLGYDVAASGKGDLGALWISAKVGSRMEQRALLTTQTEDWHFHNSAVHYFMEGLPAVKGCGDKTGLGREITWKAEQKYLGNFAGVTFNRESKGEMGARLMNMLTSGEFEIAATGKDQVNADIAMDLFSLQKATGGGGLSFLESQNPLNAASHCDIAWSAALAAHADATVEGGTGQGFALSTLPRIFARRARGMFGGMRSGRIP